VSRSVAATPAALLAVTAVVLAVVLAADPGHRPDAPEGPDPAAADRSGPPPEARAVGLRSAAKEVVVRDLMAGRTTLPAAAGMFARLNALPPAAIAPAESLLAVPADIGPLGPDGHMYAQVIEWAGKVAGIDASGRGPGAENRKALWAEFRALRAAGRLSPLPVPVAADWSALLARAEAEAAARQGFRSPRPPAPPDPPAPDRRWRHPRGAVTS
jgi:hypothetical protein